MNKIIFIFLGLLQFLITGFSQEIIISIDFFNKDTLTFYSIAGEKTSFIDSIYLRQNGSFVYNPVNLSAGFYQFRINGKPPITFIFSGEDVEQKLEIDV